MSLHRLARLVFAFVFVTATLTGAVVGAVAGGALSVVRHGSIDDWAATRGSDEIAPCTQDIGDAIIDEIPAPTLVLVLVHNSRSCMIGEDGSLELVNKCPAGSAEGSALRQHVSDWNEQIAWNGGSMTRQSVSADLRADANAAIRNEYRTNPSATSQLERLPGSHHIIRPWAEPLAT